MGGNALEDTWRKEMRINRLWELAMLTARMGVPLVPKVLRRIVRVVYGADLPLWPRRPSGLCLLHNGLGVVIHPDAVFTGPAIVFHQVTLGNAWTPRLDGAPRIGSHVFIGAGAKVLGAVSVGDYSVIGANTVVTRDVPPGHVAYGSPMQLRPIERDLMLRTYFGSLVPALGS